MAISIGNRRIGNRRIGDRRIFAVAAGLAMFLTCAFAEGDFPIEGIYTQNEMCRGDGSKQEFALVKVTAKDVSYSGGVCSIDSKQQDGDRLAMRVTCKFSASGAVMASGVTFTKKDNNTFDMAQQEGTYRAVLHRCPG